eukprot:TRINITY_DN9904_c0_g1_i2.p1 TRINITY_DN9904_c0_g1~~TRINITY_DN9904_c0_g1_i2.p1  ORF type:complete len:117 (+),score=13.31 TRINITY_DN9904_c0_g1_i2:93-443(+)
MYEGSRDREGKQDHNHGFERYITLTDEAIEVREHKEDPEPIQSIEKKQLKKLCVYNSFEIDPSVLTFIVEYSERRRRHGRRGRLGRRDETTTVTVYIAIKRGAHACESCTEARAHD